MPESASARATRLLNELDDDDRLPIKQAAAILGKSYPTICRYRDNNWIRTFLVGSRTFVTVRELRRFNRYGNYDPNDPSSDPDSMLPPKSAEELAAEPLPIIATRDGLDLSELTLEQRNRLGAESLMHNDRNTIDED